MSDDFTISNDATSIDGYTPPSGFYGGPDDEENPADYADELDQLNPNHPVVKKPAADSKAVQAQEQRAELHGHILKFKRCYTEGESQFKQAALLAYQMHHNDAYNAFSQTWEIFCEKHLEISVRRGYELLDAVKVERILCDASHKISARQVKVLKAVPDDKIKPIWAKAKQIASKKTLVGKAATFAKKDETGKPIAQPTLDDLNAAIADVMGLPAPPAPTKKEPAPKQKTQASTQNTPSGSSAPVSDRGAVSPTGRLIPPAVPPRSDAEGTEPERLYAKELQFDTERGLAIVFASGQIAILSIDTLKIAGIPL